MSWAAHNPEKYEEFLREGASAKLQSLYVQVWGDIPDSEVFDQIVDSICEEAPEVWEALYLWSAKEGSEAMGNYFAGLGDAERARIKEDGDKG